MAGAADPNQPISTLMPPQLSRQPGRATKISLKAWFRRACRTTDTKESVSPLVSAAKVAPWVSYASSYDWKVRFIDSLSMNGFGVSVSGIPFVSIA